MIGLVLLWVDAFSVTERFATTFLLGMDFSDLTFSSFWLEPDRSFLFLAEAYLLLGSKPIFYKILQ
jgi:hypothetical protein